MPKFRDIPEFTKTSSYMVHVSLAYLPDQYAKFVLDYSLDVSPDLQRKYVWTESQKIRFMEYMLRGGTSGMDIYCNSPEWNRTVRMSWFVLVDGKQRLDAALGFLNNEFPIFGGNYFRDYTDKPDICRANFRWHVNDLHSREECLQWYIDLNQGGTVHTEDELDFVKDLLNKKEDIIIPSKETIRKNSRIDERVSIFEKPLREFEEENKRRETYFESLKNTSLPVKKTTRSKKK